MTHADKATELVAKLDPRVWAKACSDAVLHNDFAMLERTLPGVEFTVQTPKLNMRTVSGKCTDGSIAVWAVGLA